MLRARLFILVALSLTTLSPALAQRDALVDVSSGVETANWLVGLTGGFSMNEHTGGFRSGPGREEGPLLDDGRGSGFQVGVTAEYLLSRFFALHGRVVYDVRPGHFEATYPDTLVLVGPGTTLTGDTTARADVGYRLVNTDLLIAARVIAFSPSLYGVFAAGPSIGLVVGTDATQWAERTDGTGPRMSFREGPIAASMSTRLAVKGGGGIEWNAADRIWVNARVLYEKGITDVTSAENWQLNSLLVECDILITL